MPGTKQPQKTTPPLQIEFNFARIGNIQAQRKAESKWEKGFSVLETYLK